MGANAQESATQKRAHSVVGSTTTSFDDSALQPPPSKHGKEEPLEVFAVPLVPGRRKVINLGRGVIG